MTQSRNRWQAAGEYTDVLIRPDGPGNNWQMLDIASSFTSPSGGGRTVETVYERAGYGLVSPIETRYTGNPNPYTAQFGLPLNKAVFLQQLIRASQFGDEIDPCLQIAFPDIVAQQRCGAVGNGNYDMAVGLIQCAVTAENYSDNLANFDNTNADVRWQFDVSAPVKYHYLKCRHLDASGTTSTLALNKVVRVPLTTELIAVGDGDGASQVPQLFYRPASGTWASAIDMSAFANTSNATSLAVVGQYVLVGTPEEGIAYALLDDIRAGGSVTFTIVAPFDTGSDFVNDIAVTDSNTVWAVGDGGHIFRSLTAGLSFTLYDDGVATSENLNSLSFASDSFGAAGGANGTLLRFSNGTWSTVTVSGLSDAIVVVRIPPGRPDEVYIGTDAGEILRSRNFDETTPTFETLAFAGSGSGIIDDIQFAGYKGDVMFVIQTDGSSDSRILRDRSGGAMGVDVEIIGTFAAPANNGFNSFVPLTVNSGVVVGEVESTYAYIGNVEGNTQ